jgi:hypothetical protein
MYLFRSARQSARQSARTERPENRRNSGFWRKPGTGLWTPGFFLNRTEVQGRWKYTKVVQRLFSEKVGFLTLRGITQRPHMVRLRH